MTDMASVPVVAVVAHAGKSFGGGLPELRKALAREGVTDPLWYEVKKSRHAPACARQAAARGVDVIFVWGGDGTVQRCIDAVAGTGTVIAILPAGTANLLALNLQQARPDDGLLQVGVVTAKNPAEWARTFSRLTLGQAERSPFVEVTRGTKVRIRFGRKIPYELDGGARPARRELRIKARPGSVMISVPAAAANRTATAGGGYA